MMGFDGGVDFWPVETKNNIAADIANRYTAEVCSAAEFFHQLVVSRLVGFDIFINIADFFLIEVLLDTVTKAAPFCSVRCNLTVHRSIIANRLRFAAICNIW